MLIILSLYNVDWNKLKKKDSDTIKTLCKNTNVLKEIYFFRDPVSPYVASLREKKNIDIKKIISLKKIVHLRN